MFDDSCAELAGKKTHEFISTKGSDAIHNRGLAPIVNGTSRLCPVKEYFASQASVLDGQDQEGAKRRNAIN